MSGDRITYTFPSMADYTSSLMSFSAELDQIQQEAQHELAGLAGYYETEQGSDAYKAAQAQINQGIEEGQMVIRSHGDAVDTAAQGLQSADAAAASRFG